MKAWKEITRILLLVAGCVVLYLLLQQTNLLASEGYSGDAAPMADGIALRDASLRQATDQERAAVQAALRGQPPASAGAMTDASAVQPMDSFPSAGAPAQFEPIATSQQQAAGSIQKVEVKPASKQPGFCADPAQCWPQQQLTSDDLLPKDQAAAWAELHPEGQGSLRDRNFVEAGYMIGMSSGVTKNSNMQLRSDPPVPRFSVGPWMQSTLENTDHMRRPLE